MCEVMLLELEHRNIKKLGHFLKASTETHFFKSHHLQIASRMKGWVLNHQDPAVPIVQNQLTSILLTGGLCTKREESHFFKYPLSS